ncbi:MAG: polyprenyl synthetase family protein [Clostridiaceae bacterium]|nr:polyprenyl synthetase family protein [Clostridiaceae bacterium]
MDWRLRLDEYINIINKEIEQYISSKGDKNKTLIEAMEYSLKAGGKRLRPVLALASYDIFNDHVANILPYACGLEMIHTYSLIHDDLPAMDNDDYRRGKPTNHKVYGEGIAILAGDGLLNYAFEIMLRDALTHNNIRPFVESIHEIAAAAGVNGMIGGQVVDLESENKAIDAETLDYIHLNKTAALITAPLKIGAIIAQADQEDIENMGYIGENLGLAFQIRDDILDIVGTQEKLGKNIGSDEGSKKATYPAIHGIDHSIEKVKELTSNANKALSKYNGKARFLSELSNYLVSRES